MNDRENVIKAYECCKNSFNRICEKCPYEKDCCHDGIPMFVIKKMVALLEDQEAVRPILTPWIVNDDGEVTVYKMECGKCGIQFYYEDQKYCSECGTLILWEGR